MEERFEEEIQQNNESQHPHYKPKHSRFVMSKTTYYALIGIFSAVIVLGCIYIGGYHLETGEAEEEYDALASIHEQGMGENQPPVSTGNSGITGSDEPSGSFETEPPAILPELKPIYEMNNDLVGWLDFPYDNLNINYPVTQSPYEEDFYLDHKFDRTPNGDVAIGCPYVPLNCDVFEPSDHVIIYGHYLQDGGMFGKLPWYREKSYWESHQTFRFDTLYERHTYRIFAVFKTAGTQYTEDGKPWGYPYHRATEFSSQEEFDKFIADVKGAAFTEGGYQGYCFYDTGITPQYGDKLLCLSTCEYTMKDPDGIRTNGRLVVMAVRIS